MRSIGGGIESDFLNPVIDDPRVLSYTKVRRLANAAGDKEALRLQASSFDPRLQRVPRWGRDCELHRTLCLLLQYDGSDGNAITMAYITHAQPHEVASTQFAVDAEVQ